MKNEECFRRYFVALLGLRLLSGHSDIFRKRHPEGNRFNPRSRDLQNRAVLDCERGRTRAFRTKHLRRCNRCERLASPKITVLTQQSLPDDEYFRWGISVMAASPFDLQTKCCSRR